MNRQPKENFLVMVADDSADDRYLLRTALGRAGRLKLLNEVADGAEAIAYLKSRAAARSAGDALFPDLLLLDLKMPHKDGFEVLRWLRTQGLEQLMVVVLTDSMDPNHIRQALDLGADLFQVKPYQHHERIAMVLALEQKLMTTVSSGAGRRTISASVVRAAARRNCAAESYLSR